MEFSKTLLAVDKTLPAVACGSYNVACGCLRFSGRPTLSDNTYILCRSNEARLHHFKSVRLQKLNKLH